MAIASERLHDIVVLVPEDRLDTSTAPVLAQVIERLFEGGERKLLVDLARVTYVSSIGLSVCLRGAKLASAHGGRFLLCCPNETVSEVLEIAGLRSVLDVHATRDSALAALDWLAPRPPRGLAGPRNGLSIPEELLLLALDEGTGRFVPLPRYALDFALAAGVLMELQRLGRVDSDLDSLTVVDRTPLGDAVLDPALAAIAGASRPQGAEHWIQVLAREGTDIRRRVVDRLVARRILERRGKVLGWLGARRYPVIDGREVREVRARVLGILRDDEVPDAQDVAIIALADACAVFDALLDMDEMLDVRDRIRGVARMDLQAQAMTRALASTQSLGDWEGAPHGVYTRA